MQGTKINMVEILGKGTVHICVQGPRVELKRPADRIIPEN